MPFSVRVHPAPFSPRQTDTRGGTDPTFDRKVHVGWAIFPVKMGVGWRRLWRLLRARCAFFFAQGGSNIIEARRTCRYDHPVAFGCHRGVDPKVGFEVYFICERLNVWFPIQGDMQHPCVHINTSVPLYELLLRSCTPTRRLKVPLGIGEERHQKGGWSTQWCLESGLLLPFCGQEV